MLEQNYLTRHKILIHILKKTPNAGDKSKDHVSFKKFEDKNRTAADGAQNGEKIRLPR